MKKHLLILSITTFIVSACAPSRPSVPLVGTTWKLTTYGIVDSPKPAVPESEGMIIFGADGKVTGIGACNEFSGDYEVKGEQITVSAINWGSENCPNPDMRQESNMSSLLKDTAEFKINDNTLTLTKKLPNGNNVVITFEAVSASNAVITSDAVKILQDYYQALTDGDIDKAMSYVADDAVFIDPMGKYVGKENIRKVYEPQMNKGGHWEPSNIKDINGKGRLIYDFTAYINDNPVFSGPGLTVVQDGRILFDGSEASWKGECKRDPAQSFCGD